MGRFFWKYRTVAANFTHLFVQQTDTSSLHLSQMYRELCLHILRQVKMLLGRSHPPTINTPRAAALLPQLRQGGILLTAHLGYWEWMGAYLTAQQIPLVAPYAPPRNLWTHKLLHTLRNRWGYTTINLQQHPQQIIPLLRQNKLITFLLDQNHRATQPPAFRTVILNRTAEISPWLPWLTKVAPMQNFYAGRIVRRSDGIFEFDVVPLDNPLTEYGAWLSSEILHHPAQWVSWTHKLFASNHPEIYR